MVNKIKVNKTKLVNEILTRDPHAKPRDIVAEIKTKHGVDIKPEVVSQIKIKLKSRLDRRAQNGDLRRLDDSLVVNRETLQKLREFVHHAGGENRARIIFDSVMLYQELQPSA